MPFKNPLLITKFFFNRNAKVRSLLTKICFLIAEKISLACFIGNMLTSWLALTHVAELHDGKCDVTNRFDAGCFNLCSFIFNYSFFNLPHFQKSVQRIHFSSCCTSAQWQNHSRTLQTWKNYFNSLLFGVCGIPGYFFFSSTHFLTVRSRLACTHYCPPLLPHPLTPSSLTPSPPCTVRRIEFSPFGWRLGFIWNQESKSIQELRAVGLRKLRRGGAVREHREPGI